MPHRAGLGGAPRILGVRSPLCLDGPCQPRHPVEALRAGPPQRAVWTTPEESLTVWFARLELPEEFHAGIDNNNVDIVDFVFSERRFEGIAPADISKAHHVRGYLLQSDGHD